MGVAEGIHSDYKSARAREGQNNYRATPLIPFMHLFATIITWLRPKDERRKTKESKNKGLNKSTHQQINKQRSKQINTSTNKQFQTIPNNSKQISSRILFNPSRCGEYLIYSH